MSMTPIILGAISGCTIFLGLPLALLKNVSVKVRSFLTAVSTGILVFLLVEITHRVMENIEDLSISAAEGFHTLKETFLYGGIFAAGLFIGLMGLVWFENRFIRTAKDDQISAPAQ